jgi:hypothetical protein
MEENVQSGQADDRFSEIAETVKGLAGSIQSIGADIEALKASQPPKGEGDGDGGDNWGNWEGVEDMDKAYKARLDALDSGNRETRAAILAMDAAPRVASELAKGLDARFRTPEAEAEIASHLKNYFAADPTRVGKGVDDATKAVIYQLAIGKVASSMPMGATAEAPGMPDGAAEIPNYRELEAGLAELWGRKPTMEEIKERSAHYVKEAV